MTRGTRVEGPFLLLVMVMYVCGGRVHVDACAVICVRCVVLCVRRDERVLKRPREHLQNAPCVCRQYVSMFETRGSLERAHGDADSDTSTHHRKLMKTNEEQ